MDQEKKYFKTPYVSTPARKFSAIEANELLEIFEDTYELGKCIYDDYYRQIALLHLLIGFPNTDKTYSEENTKINQWIYKLHNTIQEYRTKYEH